MQSGKIASVGTFVGVILADVVRSRSRDDFRVLRDTALNELSERHLDRRWIETRYAVTAWDEFQVVLRAPRHAADVLWSIRLAFHPLRVRIGIGFGIAEVSRTDPTPINVSATGDAFVRARRALQSIHNGKDTRFEPITHADTGDAETDLTVNTVLHLLDLVVDRVTPSQWEAILAYERLGRQDRVAEFLGKDESTISRALKRAAYWYIRESHVALGSVLDRALPRYRRAGTEERT